MQEAGHLANEGPQSYGRLDIHPRFVGNPGLQDLVIMLLLRLLGLSHVPFFFSFLSQFFFPFLFVFLFFFEFLVR